MVDNANDILRWFLRKDSIVQCFIRDICEAAPATQQGSNFLWYLGTVPFRVVRFVGIVIGIKIYDRRSLYFVDDGTATIQCIYLHPVVKTRAAVDNSKPPSIVLPPPVEPLCEIGATVCIVGRVESWRDIRQIIIDDIATCSSSEEVKHWIQTSHLHKTYYCTPFVIPPLPVSVPVLVPPTPTSVATPSTATMDHATTDSVIHTSVSKFLSTSTIRSEEELLRLRHPSRLRSRELTKNVFKIYLKNFMDIVSHNSLRPHREKFNIDSSLHRSPQLKGFRLSYLRQIPELSTLCKRIVALDSPSKDRVTRSSLKKTYIWAIRELIKEGTIVLHDKNGLVWETFNHYPPVWRISSRNNDDSKASKSSIMKNSTNASRHIQEIEETGEVSDTPPKEESYIPLIPEVLCPSIVNILKELTTPERVQSRSAGQRAATHIGLSIREIRHHLNQDMRWEHVGDYIIVDTLTLLEKTGTVQQAHNGRWRFQ